MCTVYINFEILKCIHSKMSHHVTFCSFEFCSLFIESESGNSGPTYNYFSLETTNKHSFSVSMFSYLRTSRVNLLYDFLKHFLSKCRVIVH